MKLYKTLFLFVIAISMSSMANAQDLMAREATTDFKLKSSNTAKLIKQIQKQEEQNMAMKVYGDSWDNKGVNVYKNMPKPDELVIDLRDFSMPIKSRIVTSNYGYRKRFRRNHYGIDIDGYTGDTIYAAFAGKVRVRQYNAGGFGYYIVVRHNNGLETVYGHLSKQLVDVNQVVKSGQPIGLCGNTGRSYGSHLHFETRVLGEPINPALIFDIPAQDIVADTYTYRSRTNHNVAVADQVLADNGESRLLAQDDADVDTKAQNSRYSSREARAQEKPYGKKSHKVRKGDTLYSIARKYKVTIKELCRRNNLKESARLHLGQTLFLN